MLKFIPRTERASGDIKVLYQACNTDKGRPSFAPDGVQVLNNGNCIYCRYWNDWSNRNTFLQCSAKHACNAGLYPFIQMSRPLNDSVNDYPVDPEGNEFHYQATGIYKQVKFEGVPLYVQLYVISSDHGLCNADCWYHSWRFANKRTWRQCGEKHLCQNNGSLWFLMAPTNAGLYQKFLELF